MKKKDTTIYDIYEHQPSECRQPLPFKDITAPAYVKRVLLLDPKYLYERVRYKLNPYSRYNYISFNDLFPDCGDVCSCGCGKVLAGNKRKYATKECQQFAVAIWNIIAGVPDKIKWYLRYYYGNSNCIKCGEPGGYDLDHRVPLKNGGAGCWLSNFDLLCIKCHAIKTAIENDWKKSKHLN